MPCTVQPHFAFYPDAIALVRAIGILLKLFLKVNAKVLKFEILAQLFHKKRSVHFFNDLSKRCRNCSQDSCFIFSL